MVAKTSSDSKIWSVQMYVEVVVCEQMLLARFMPTKSMLLKPASVLGARPIDEVDTSDETAARRLPAVERRVSITSLGSPCAPPCALLPFYTVSSQPLNSGPDASQGGKPIWVAVPTSDVKFVPSTERRCIVEA